MSKVFNAAAMTELSISSLAVVRNLEFENVKSIIREAASNGYKEVNLDLNHLVRSYIHEELTKLGFKIEMGGTDKISW